MKYPTQIIANGELQYDMELEPDTINRVKDCMYEHGTRNMEKSAKLYKGLEATR